MSNKNRKKKQTFSESTLRAAERKEQQEQGGDDDASSSSSVDNASSSGTSVLYNDDPYQTPRNESEMEMLARRIEDRRNNRIPVPFTIRKAFLKQCYQIAVREGYNNRDRINLEDLYAMRDDKLKHDFHDKYPERADKSIPAILRKLGFFDHEQVWENIFKRAQHVIETSHLKSEGWFYYRDFVYYHTELVSYWPWNRNPTVQSFLAILIFYVSTAVFFCSIVGDDDICPVDPTSHNRPYYGWISALYFASTTMSTVGYGDLTVQKTNAWHILYGTLYMIASVIIAVVFFRRVAEFAFNRVKGPFGNAVDRTFERFSNLVLGEPKPDDHLYVQIRRLQFKMVCQTIVQFSLLNLIGILASRFFVNRYANEAGEDWGWMRSLYWAVMTTTTIGYGDLNMTFEMRWFQIIYLTLSTYFASNALGRLGRLVPDTAEARRQYAWARKGASTGIVHDYRTDEMKATINQYEYAIASLLVLGKINRNDLVPIMDKFHVVSDPDDGLIHVLPQTEVSESDTVKGKLQARRIDRHIDDMTPGERSDSGNQDKEEGDEEEGDADAEQANEADKNEEEEREEEKAAEGASV